MKVLFPALATLNIFSILHPALAFSAENRWCFTEGSQPPCDGQAGECTQNLDGSKGGFVSHQASVQKDITSGRNKPFIGLQTQVCDGAKISGQARLLDHSKVYGNAHVYGHATISGYAKVYGRARVLDQAEISGWAEIYGSARVFDRAKVFDEAKVYGSAWIFGTDAWVSGEAQVFENARVYQSGWVYGNASVSGNAEVSEGAHVFGTALLSGVDHLQGNQELSLSADFGPTPRVTRELDLSTGPGAHLAIEDHPIYFDAPYRGSEAEAYRSFLEERQRRRTWISQVTLQGQKIEIADFNFEDSDLFEASYEVKTQALAFKLSMALGREIAIHSCVRESEIKLNLFASEIIAESEGSDYQKNLYGFENRASQQSALSPGADRYLEWVRDKIGQKLKELNESQDSSLFEINSSQSELRYYHNPMAPSLSGIFIHNEVDPVYRYTGAHFFKMMDAIGDQDESQFLQNMIDLATAFHPSRLSARNGFIETYTYLYVAKRFPNPLIRKRYLHFTLRCGGIY